MLLAIDIGNTSTHCGLWDEGIWRHTWRLPTEPDATPERLRELTGKAYLEFPALVPIDGAICASVVPALDEVWARFVPKAFEAQLRFLRPDTVTGLELLVENPLSVGADRIANCLGALGKFNPPIIVVDFGTATTFEAIDKTGAFVGGAIVPGVQLSADALFAKTAKLTPVPLDIPKHAIGRNTKESIQSGILFAYAGGIDAVTTRINAELGGNSKIIATGGLGRMFMDLCHTLESYEPMLTLDGLRVAAVACGD